MGAAEGLPVLPDTQYLLCRNADNDNELALAIFNAMQSTHDPYNMIGNADGALLLDDEE